MEHFKTIPWCAELISAPELREFTPTCRQPHSDAPVASRDQLFRKTLNHGDAIPNCIGLYQDPTKLSAAATTEPKPPQDGPTLYIKAATLLFDLKPGVKGYNGSAHGGLISSMIDEAMGSLISINYLTQATLEAKGGRLPPGTLDLNSTRVFTAGMNVRFQKPVPVPGAVAVTASFVRIEGRKIAFDVRVTGERGVEFARCDGLWLSLPLEKM